MRKVTWMLVGVAIALAIVVIVCAGGLTIHGLYERSQRRVQSVELMLPDGLRIERINSQWIVAESDQNFGEVIAPALGFKGNQWSDDLSVFKIERWTQACIFVSRAPFNDDYQYAVRFDDGAVLNSLADLRPYERAYATKPEAIALIKTGVPNSTLIAVYELD